MIADETSWQLQSLCQRIEVTCPSREWRLQKWRRIEKKLRESDRRNSRMWQEMCKAWWPLNRPQFEQTMFLVSYTALPHIFWLLWYYILPECSRNRRRSTRLKYSGYLRQNWWTTTFPTGFELPGAGRQENHPNLPEMLASRRIWEGVCKPELKTPGTVYSKDFGNTKKGKLAENKLPTSMEEFSNLNPKKPVETGRVARCGQHLQLDSQ